MSSPYDLAIDNVGRMSLSELAITAGYTPPPRDARGRFTSRQTAAPGAVTNFLTSIPSSRRTISSSDYRDIAAAVAETPMYLSPLEQRRFQPPTGSPPPRLLNHDRVRTAAYNPETPLLSFLFEDPQPNGVISSAYHLPFTSLLIF